MRKIMKNGKINGLLDVYGIIYSVKNKVNGKYYIGQTIKKNGFKDRYSVKYGRSLIEGLYMARKKSLDGKEEYEKNILITRDILLQDMEKYGLDSFEVNECIDYAFSRQELDVKEKMYIKYYKSLIQENGYNKTAGGQGLQAFAGQDEITRKLWKNEEYRTKITNAITAATTTKEYREKQSKIQKEIQNRPEVKEKQRKTQKEVQNKPEVKEKQRKAQGGANNARSRMVVSLTSIEKNYDRKIFSYIKEAAQWVSEKIGHPYNNGEISACCRGQRDSFGEMPDGSKLSWRFLEDFSNEELNNMLNSVEFLNKEKEMIEKQLEENKNSLSINKEMNTKKFVTKNIKNCYAPKPVVCVFGIENKYNRKVFPNLGEAESWMKENNLKGINRRRISLCCKGKINYQGYGFNGEKLKWRFLYDLSNEELNNLLLSIELTEEEKEIVQKQILKN